MTSFKGQSQLNKSTPVEIITDNLQSWLDWGFIKQGGYTNITIPESGVYGGDWSRLRPVIDPNYTNGQVWEGARKGWIWEKNINNVPDPIRVSGVTINGTFNFFTSHTPDADDTIDGYVDYPNGRIILSSGIATNVPVQASYSYRWVQTYKANTLDYIRQVQYRSGRVDDTDYLSTSGDWSNLSETRIQLPAIIVNRVRTNRKPYQLGGGHFSYNDFLCDVLAENQTTAERIAFTLTEQKEKRFVGYNPNTLGNSGTFPLDLHGSVQSGALNFPELANTYPFRKIAIIDTNMENTTTINQNLYLIPVTIKTEVILPENY